jgi:hypothetical protein
MGRAFKLGCGGVLALLLLGFCVSLSSTPPSGAIATMDTTTAAPPRPSVVVDSSLLGRGMAARKTLRRKVDEMSSAVTLTHPSLPRFVNSRTSIVPYFIGSEARPSFRVRFAYVADDWLFVRTISVKTDSGYYDLTPPQFGDEAIKRDNAAGEIWEWWDAPGDEHYAMLLDIGRSAKVLVRFSGDKYHQDWRPSVEDRRAIRAMAEARYSFEPRPDAP